MSYHQRYNPCYKFLPLANQYSLIALHRPALTSHTSWLRSRVSHLCAGTQWRSRLRYSLCIGAASARSILKKYNDMTLYSNGSRLTTLNQLLLAIMTLSIYVTKIPSSLLNGSDLAVCTIRYHYCKYSNSDLVDGPCLCRKH